MTIEKLKRLQMEACLEVRKTGLAVGKGLATFQDLEAASERHRKAWKAWDEAVRVRGKAVVA